MKTNTDLIVLYVTCESVEQAKEIGRSLLEKRLCGCINILGEISPMYWWPPKNGTIEEGKEVVLLVKTLERKLAEVEKEITRIHTFDTPCIIGLPTVHVSQKYYDWLKGEME